MVNLEYINQLNEYQKEAVTADNKYLQVLAGPGSGKTRVLTTRVAWLIKEKKLKPSSVVVVTFTNKAAKEMKERLEQPSLLGTQTKFLRMGTFHSFCCRMLQRHLDWIPLKKGFSIADTTKSKHLVDMIFKDLKPRLSKFGQSMKPAVYQGLISKAKNKGLDHHQYMAKDKENDFEKDVAMVFSAYEETLLSSNMVDFDGLLLHGRDLFKSHPQSVNFVQHVLVDEFQDTNALQYEITALLTGEGRKALTVVGDPDQSIYGWRNANKEHFDFMESDYKGTRVVDLKENYRSTANIISGASRVVEADKSRKPREHFTNNHSGVPISVLKASSELDEASVVVDEIKRIIKYSNGLINNKDIAILFRMNFLTLNFENALNRERIPYILVGGTRFLDRMEVKDVLGYLSFFYNPRDVSAFIRLINVPKRGLGDVSVKKIQSVAAAQNWTLVEALDHIVAGHPAVASIRIMAKSKMLLKTLLILYNEVEAMMVQKTSPGKILKHIIDAIGYMEYLETDYKKDYESRKANVEELITFANRQGEQEGPEDESGMDAVGRFLEYCTLSGDSKEHEEAKGGRISLITIHSAKGLEWPCVFIAGCEDGIIPMSRAEDPLEESRVLYVGMTRAKCFLYCTLANERQRWDGPSATSLSPYLKDLPDNAYQRCTPVWNKDVREWTAKMLRLPYTENEGLHLEDAGTTINAEYYSNEYDNLYQDEDNYADYGYYNYDRNYAKNKGYHSFTTTTPLYKIKQESNIIAKPSKTLAQRIKNEPTSTTTTPAFTSAQQIKKESSSTATTPTFTSVLGSMQQKDNLFRNDTKPNRSALDSLFSGQQIKREITAGQSKSAMNSKKVKKQKIAMQESPTQTIEQCVSKGIQVAGTNKNSFSLDDVVSAVNKEAQQNQLGQISDTNIRDQANKELGSLVKQGSLFRFIKDGGIRYFVTE